MAAKSQGGFWCIPCNYRFRISSTCNCGFHLQQSSEKYLKAFLEYHEIRFARTHDIEYLLKLCAQISPEFNTLTAAKLTDFAVDLRYPGFMHEPSENELKEALDASLQIQKLVLSLMVFWIILPAVSQYGMNQSA